MSKFAELLTNAIYKIHDLEGIPLHIIQEELGIALGRTSGSAIDYWRRGNIPTKPEEVRL